MVRAARRSAAGIAMIGSTAAASTRLRDPGRRRHSIRTIVTRPGSNAYAVVRTVAVSPAIADARAAAAGDGWRTNGVVAARKKINPDMNSDSVRIDAW